MHRGRRLPDGGHQPGGDLACRAPQARAADRAVRRQPDFHRRADQPFGLRRPDRALQRLGLAHGERRRARPRGGRARHRECAKRDRPAVADRLPHRHRLWRAEARPVRPRPMARRSAVEEINGAREKLGWRHEPFEVPKPVLAAWRAVGTRHRAANEAWTKAAKRLDAASARASDRSGRCEDCARSISRRWQAAQIQISAREAAKLATRQSSQKVLERLVPVVPGLIGGSADLTGSNGTLTKLHKIVKAGDFAGNYIHYGVREHGMAAAMNGMALHGGIVPYGGSFLVFTDYCRPSIRLSALMGTARDLCHDARLDRARRGRPDTSAGRASRVAPRDPQSQRVPPGRLGRVRRVLGARVARQGRRHRSWR